MTYKINGQAFVVPPSTGRWISPDSFGIDGNGHTIYSAKTDFELRWSNLEPSGTYQLYEFFRSLSITGSAVVELPRYGYNDYSFFAYSGCVLDIPNFGNFFFENTLDVSITVTNIRYDTF